jgi:hypothetical protein
MNQPRGFLLDIVEAASKGEDNIWHTLEPVQLVAFVAAMNTGEEHVTDKSAS